MTTKATTKEYTRTLGRRKTATAVVKLTPASKNSYKINGKDIEVYFPTKEMQKIVYDAMALAGAGHKFEIVITAKGGGIHAQAESVRLGIARALSEIDGELRIPLKKAKMLKRDPRQVERKKFGLKKARKSPQWSKR